MRTVGPVGPVSEKTYAADSALTLGYVVTSGAADAHATAITALGQVPLGIVSQGVVNVGDPAPVVRLGDARAIAGAAVANGVLVKADASGRLIPAVAGDLTIGRAESTASGFGDEFLVFVFPGSM